MQTSPTKQNKASHKESTPESKLLVIEKKFNVPVSRLFETFTHSESLKAWWWPAGLYADVVKIDFREGGRYFINMKGYERGGGGMTGQYEEIIQNKRIVMTDQFADENGRAITAQQAEMPGAWPELVYITFEFESLTEKSSRFKLSQQGIPNDLQKDCYQGWSESFDKLDKYLSERNQ